MRFIGDLLYKALVMLYAALCFYLALKGNAATLMGFGAAGALSLAFLKLDSFTEFSGAGFKAKIRKKLEDIEKEIEPIRSKQTEPQTINDDRIAENEKVDELDIDKKSLKVLKALTNGKYSWRTMNGLLRETGMKTDDLLIVLESLEDKGLATVNLSTAARAHWGATMRGYIISSMNGEDS